MRNNRVVVNSRTLLKSILAVATLLAFSTTSQAFNTGGMLQKTVIKMNDLYGENCLKSDSANVTRQLAGDFSDLFHHAALVGSDDRFSPDQNDPWMHAIVSGTMFIMGPSDCLGNKFSSDDDVKYSGNTLQGLIDGGKVRQVKNPSNSSETLTYWTDASKCTGTAQLVGSNQSVVSAAHIFFTKEGIPRSNIENFAVLEILKEKNRFNIHNISVMKTKSEISNILHGTDAKKSMNWSEIKNYGEDIVFIKLPKKVSGKSWIFPEPSDSDHYDHSDDFLLSSAFHHDLYTKDGGSYNVYSNAKECKEKSIPNGHELTDVNNVLLHDCDTNGWASGSTLGLFDFSNVASPTVKLKAVHVGSYVRKDARGKPIYKEGTPYDAFNNSGYAVRADSFHAEFDYFLSRYVESI